MKILYFVILCVLFSPTMTNELKNEQKCEKTNCTLMDDPVCVKIKITNKKEVYVVAKNECEIIYASCQKDVDAKVVPMVNCRRDVQNITRKRNKRDVDGDTRTNEDQESLNGQSGDNENEGQELLNDQSGDDENEGQEFLKGQSADAKKLVQELLKGQLGDDENEDQELNRQSGDDKNEDQELNGQSGDDENEDQELKGQSGDDENDDQELNGQSGDDENEDQELLNGQSEDDEHKNANQNNSELNPNHLDDQEANTTYTDENDIPNMISVDNIGADYDQQNQKVNLEESKKDCPKVCPTRDVMVCARCKHNIHRTFLSLCHLKMFACKHTSEKLQLVKREPCVQSAPFLSRFKETKGRISVSGELDAVHKFIFCRDKKLLSKDDPRCIVVKQEK